jgi:hypothetical protein
MEITKLYNEAAIECLAGDTVSLQLDSDDEEFTPTSHTMECRIASAYAPSTIITTISFASSSDGFSGEINEAFTKGKTGLYNCDFVMDAGSTPQFVARIYLNIKKSTS